MQALNKFVDQRHTILSPSYVNKCPVAALRRDGYKAWIETERDSSGRAYDVLITNAPTAIVNICAGHGLAFARII